ncbi:MAG: T9SS type A sorting domain-containing protein [Candidatus Eisenbacteria bacterium]
MKRAAIAAALLLLLTAGAGEAQILIIFETVVEEGDLIPGVGAVTTIDNLAVNDNFRWLVEADTDHPNTDADAVIIRNDTLYLREDQPLSQPPGATLNTFDAVRLNNDGHSGWNFFLSGTSGSNDDSGIYYDTTLVIQESDVSTAPGFSPGTQYIGFFETHINDNREILIVASVEDTAVASTVDRALVIAEVDALGNLLSETLIAMEEDTLAGQSEGIVDFGTGPHQTAFNNNGEALYFADLTGATTTDGVIYLNHQLIAQEGSPAPVAGRNYELLSSRGLDVNNGGGHVFKANLDGNTADDEIIVKNGGVLAQEGGTMPDIAPYLFTSFGTTSGPIQIGDNGKVVWFGDWNDPNTDFDTGLFLDSVLIIQEGVTMVDTDLIDEISSGQDAFDMSPSGQWLLFEVTFVNGNNAAVILDLTDPTAVATTTDLVAPAVLRAAPNPFSSETVVRFGLTERENVDLRVYDVRGRLVAVLADEAFPAGEHRVTWNGRDEGGRAAAAGTYFVRLKTADQSRSFRIVHVR